MAKTRKKTKAARPSEIVWDATPERMAKGDYSEMVETKAEGSSRTVKTRRFSSTKLDRMHRAGKLTWVQHFAGDWYRSKAEESELEQSVIGGYGQGVGGGVKFYAFLPRTVSAMDSANQLRAARQQWPIGMQGFMDRLLIHDDLPRYGGREAMRKISEIRRALDKLALWLRLT